MPAQTDADPLKSALTAVKNFAQDIGYNSQPDIYPQALLHVASNRSNALCESLWLLRAAKYFPITLLKALNELQLDHLIHNVSPLQQKPLSPWRIFNLTIEEILILRNDFFNEVLRLEGADTLNILQYTIERLRIENIGAAQFFAENYRYHQPVLLVSANQKRWRMVMQILGMGSASVIDLPNTKVGYIDLIETRRILTHLQHQKIPVLALTAFMDDEISHQQVQDLLVLRQHFANEGFAFYIHIEADISSEFWPNYSVNSNESFASCSRSLFNIAEVECVSLTNFSNNQSKQYDNLVLCRNKDLTRVVSQSSANLNRQFGFDH